MWLSGTAKYFKFNYKKFISYNSNIGSIYILLGICVFQFINSNMFVVSSSLGSVKLFKIDGSQPHVAEFKELISWDDIHFFRYAKRAIACNME